MENKEDLEEENSEKTVLSNGCSIEKQILIVFSKTISIILVLCFATIFYVSIFSPVTMAKFTDSIGMQSVSLYYSKVQYRRDKDINSLYTVINKSIAIDSFKNMEKYIDLLLKQDDYYNFIAFIEAENIKNASKNANQQDKIPLMISFANEDAYLRNKYVQSLIMNAKFADANKFADADLLLNDTNMTLNSRFHWSYTHIINAKYYDCFGSDNLLNIENFANQIYNLFMGIIPTVESLSSSDFFDFLILRNTIKKVYNDILKLENNVEFSSLTFAEVRARLDNLSKK